MNGSNMSPWVPAFFAALALIVGLVTGQLGVALVGVFVALVVGGVVMLTRKSPHA